MVRSYSTLRIVQFNVENLFVFMDHYVDQDLNRISEAEWQKLSTSTTPNKPLHKLWGLAASIEDMNPDILCLNEVGGHESLDNFNKYFLNSNYEVHLLEGNSNRGIDVGYLLKKGHPFKPTLISHKNRPIDFLYPNEKAGPGNAKSHYFSRDVAELRLFVKDEKKPQLVLLITHLKSKLDPENKDFQGRLRREAELKTLVKIYNEVRTELDKVPVIVCGDFNGHALKSRLDSEFESLYKETDLIEPLEQLEAPEERRISQVQISTSRKATYMHIDYTLVSPELIDKVLLEHSGTYYFKNELGNPVNLPKTLEEKLALASDHFPMILDIAWPHSTD